MSKKANQSQLDTDIDKRRYKTTLERPPRMDLRKDSAPVRDPDLHSDQIQKRKDLGGTSVYEKNTARPKPKSGAKGAGEPVRFMHGFEPKKENLEKLLTVESKLDVTLKFLSEALQEFVTLKSIDVTPDGKLGGRGFVIDFSEVRQRLYSSVENISMIIDTLYDETRGVHWRKIFEEIKDEQENSPESLDDPQPKDLQDVVDEDNVKVSSIYQKVLKKAACKKE